MDMPRKGYKSLTLRTETFERFGLANVRFSKYFENQSDFMEELLIFIDKARGDFIQHLDRREKQNV